jgi:hypothetical protein
MNELLLGPCEELMKNIPDNSIDLIFDIACERIRKAIIQGQLDF